MSKLEHYEFIRVVGKGSYGEVHLVEHKKDRKQYVVKKLSLVKASSRERKAAEQEAKLLSTLRHPNIVSYKDSFDNESDGHLYIVMGFAEGGDLYTKLREQREKREELSEQKVVRWFIQISMALQYLHERRILHRDLKTQNIFLTKSSMIKVGDLGIARVLETASDMATTLIGTPYYMSPELFQNKAYNHKSDVWALGCCAYEMITLKHAFNAKDMNSLVYKILKRKLPRMPEAYSDELCDLIKTMLHHLPEKRPSVNRILRNSYIKRHIQLFLDESSRKRRPNSGSSRPRSGPGASSAGSTGRSRRPTALAQDVTPEPTKQDQVVAKVDVRIEQVISVTPIQEVAENSPDCSFKSESTLKPTLKSPKQTVHDKTIENFDHQIHKNTNNNNTATNSSAQIMQEEPKSLPQEAYKHSSYPEKLTPTPPPERDHSVSSNSSASSSSRKARPLPKRPTSAKSPNRRPISEPSSNSKDLGSSMESNISTASSRNTARQRRREKKEKERQMQMQNLPDLRKSRSAEIKKKTETSKVTYVDRVGRTEVTQPRVEVEQQISRSGDRKVSVSSAADNDDFVDLLQTTLRLASSEVDNASSSSNSSTNSSPPTPQENGDRRQSGFTPRATEVTPQANDYRRNPSHGISAGTLRSTQRLMDRIVALRKDCIQGLGVPLLHRAYEVLNDATTDEEVEEKLTSLLGPHKFEQWAGKIWQLKFCEESMFNHCDTITAIHP